MPLFFPDNLRNTNPDYPVISADEQGVQGYIHVADTAERDSLHAEKRVEGAVVVVGTTMWIYQSSDLSDTSWQNAANWSEAGSGGASSLDGLSDVVIDGALTTGMTLVYDGSDFVEGFVNYSTIEGSPILGLAATTNAYSDLDGLPILGLTATTNDYTDLDTLPSFVGGTNVTINETVNGAGGTEYTINSTGGAGGGDASVAAGIAQFDDTDISLPLSGQILQYNALNTSWENVNQGNPLSDLTISALAASGGGSLTFDGTSRLFYQAADLTGYLTTVSINDLTEVDTAGATSGDVLEFDGADWVAATPSGGGGDLDTLTVSTNSASGGGALTFDGTNRLFFTPADVSGTGATTLEALTDTEVISPDAGDILTYNATSSKWVAGVNPFDTLAVNQLPATGSGSLSLSGGTTLFYVPPDLSSFLTTVDIDDLTSVDTAGASSGDVLEFDGADWVAATPSSGGDLDTLTVQTASASGSGALTFDGTNRLFFTPADLPDTLDDLNFVDTTGAAPGDTLRFNGLSWAAAPLDLDDLDNVDTGGANTGDILEYDGSDWVVTTPSGGSGPVTLAYNGHLDAAIAKTYYLTTYAPVNQTVTDIKAVCGAGSCTVDFYIFGSLLVHTQTVNTGTLSATAPSGISSIPAGAELSMVISNVVGCFDFRFSMVYTQ